MQSQNQNQVQYSNQFNNGFNPFHQQIISSCFQSNFMSPMIYTNPQSQEGMIYSNQPQEENSVIPIENMFDTSSSDSHKNIFESYKDSSN
jgi:hypothetical protein